MSAMIQIPAWLILFMLLLAACTAENNTHLPAPKSDASTEQQQTESAPRPALQAEQAIVNLNTTLEACAIQLVNTGASLGSVACQTDIQPEAHHFQTELARRTLKKAYQAMAAGDCRLGLEAFEQALKAEPDSAGVARAYLQQQIDLAQQCLNRKQLAREITTIALPAPRVSPPLNQTDKERLETAPRPDYQGTFQVNPLRHQGAKIPAVFMSRTGDFLVTWRNGKQNQWDPESPEYGYFAQRYRANGEPLGSVLRLHHIAPIPYPASNHQIVMDNQGGFVMVWPAVDPAHEGEDWKKQIYGTEVFAQRYNPDGEPLGEAFQVNSYSEGAQINPRIAMDAQGHFVIAWSGMGANGRGAFFRRYNSAGEPVGDEVQLTSQSYSFAYLAMSSPIMSMDAQGNFVLSWKSVLEDDRWIGVFAQQFNSTGKASGDVFQLRTIKKHYLGAEEESAHHIAVSRQGGFVMTWQYALRRKDAPGIAKIVAQHYRPDGEPLGAEFDVITSDSGYTSTAPLVDISEQGNFVISWKSHARGASISRYLSDEGRFFQRFNSGGETDGLVFRSNTPPQSSAIRIVMDPQDNFVLVWEDNWKIVAQRYDAEGFAL